MFLKKSLFFMTALALLMFTGQASAQGPSVSLEHVSDTPGMVSGQGTTITVRISQTGVNDFPGIATAAGINIDVAFDASVVSLATPIGFFQAATATGATLTLVAFPGQPLRMPDSADLTFTTVADVTDMEFTIGITGASTIIAGQNVAIPLSETLTFNEADDGEPPPPTGPTVSLTSGGESEINRIGPDTDIVVDIGIGGLDAATMVAGGKITFSVDPSVATFKSMMAGANVIESESSGLYVVIAIPPAMLPADGKLGSVTFTTNSDYTREKFEIGVTALELITTGGDVTVTPVGALVVNDFSPYLEADPADAAIRFPAGESRTVTVTAMDLQDEAVAFTVATTGDVTASEDAAAGTVTLTATGDGTATVDAIAGGVDLEFPVSVAFDAYPVLNTDKDSPVEIPRDGEATVEVTAVGFDTEPVLSINGAAGLKKSDDGVSWDVTTSTPGDVVVTATLGNDTAEETITFEAETPELEASAAEATIPVGGSAEVVVTALGLGDGVNYSYTETGTAEVDLVTGGAMATVTASGRGSATVTVTASDADGRTAEGVTITFNEGSLTLSSADPVMVPVGGSGSTMVTVSGHANDDDVTFTVEGVESSPDGATVTLTGTGAATATVTASVGGVTATTTVEFVDGPLALEASAEAVSVAPGGMGMATVTLMGLAEGETPSFAIDPAEHGTVDGNVVTLSASGDATVTVSATVGSLTTAEATVEFSLGDLTLALADGSMAENEVLPGGSASAMFSVTGQADGAEVMLALEDGSEGATLDGMMVSASGGATAIVTAWVGEIGSNAVTVTFALGDLTLTADATTVVIGPDGGMTMVMVSGQDPAADVVFEGATENEDGMSATVSSDVAGTVIVTASVGDVSASVDVAFVPSLQTEMDVVEVPLDGSPATAVISAAGFPPGATITFNTSSNIDIQSSDDGSTLTVTSRSPGDVMVVANDGTNSAETSITFVGEGPKLEASANEATIPVGGSVEVEVAALGYADDAEISFQTNVKSREGTEGKATVDAKRGDASLTLTASGRSGAVVTVTASDGMTATDPIDVTFMAGSLALEAAKSEVMVPVGGTGSTTVTVSGQANDDDVEFAVEGEGVMSESDGATVTLSASGAATAMVTASVGEVSSESITVMFVDGTLQLVASVSEPVMVAPGGMGMATVSLMNLAEGDEATFSVDAEGVEHSIEGVTVTLSATGSGSATVSAAVNGLTTGSVTVEFVQAPLMLSSDADAAVTVAPGGMGTVMVTASGQAEGADVEFSSSDEAVTVTENEDGTSATVTASGAAMATVTAAVGDVTASVDVAFEQGALELAGDTEAYIPYDGSGSATLTASGQAEGAEVVFTVEGEGVTSASDGATVTVSASAATTAMVTAAVGDVMSNTVEVAFMDAPPELRTETPTVTFTDFGETGEATVMAVGFPEDAKITFKIIGGTGFATADGAATWTVSTAVAGVVTLEATDGTMTTVPLDITFMDPRPYLTASDLDAIIPTGGNVIVTVTSTGLDEDSIVWTFTEVSGTATVNTETHGATATLTGSGEGSASVTLMAKDDVNSTEPVTIVFRAMPTATSETPNVTVPPTTARSESATVTVEGFAEDTAVEIVVVVVSGSEDDVSSMVSEDGRSVTVTSVGSAVVEVTASGDGVTTDPVKLTFTKDAPEAPANLVVEDNPGDHGYYVMVSFPNSKDHLDVSQYRIWREMDVTTELGEDGKVRQTDDPTKAWVAWAAVDAVPSEDNVTRAVVPVTDNTATRWGVSAEVGRGSAEDVITPSGKRVFSKESVQLMAQILGLDPNQIVSEDELAQMFMPSADYIQSIIGDRKNVVFAALDPDMSVLIGDVTVPQNIRTDGHLNPILSSPITVTEGIMGAVDDTAPAVVTDVTADPDTGLITWTVSADDMTVGMINYRGYSFTIPGVLGYKVMAGASPDALAIDVTQLVVETGVLPAGTSSLQVPRALIETLIDQGLPAVFVSVVAMDGTNLSGSVPLMVELAPKRKEFVDADGNPVYLVDLNDGNLTVGFEDFIAFRMAYNTSEATSTRQEWRVFIQADLNNDTVVNFADFILFFESYGREAIGPSGKSLIPPLGVNEGAEFLLRLGSERVVVGENMFVDVSLANVQALMGYGFVLHYDAEIFEFVEAVSAAEDFLKSAGGETPLFRGWSPEAGQVHVMNAVANGSEVSGDGDIVRLVFRVLRDFEDNARFEIAQGLVFDPSQLANPLTGGVLDIQTTPTEFALLQNFPNPFNPETTIGYELAESADVTLQIYNVVGQVVRTLMAAESQSVGRYQVRWDGMDDRGVPVSSGIYFYQISAGKFQDVRKLMLLK